VSFRENHWRGPADPHTVALTNVVTHAEKADDLHHELGRHHEPRAGLLVAWHGCVLVIGYSRRLA
jgi:hypothetical protein